MTPKTRLTLGPMYSYLSYLMCCVVVKTEIQGENKASRKYCERKRNTATHLHSFGAKRLTAKETLLTGNYCLVLLKKQRWNKSWTENARWRFKLKTKNANNLRKQLTPQSVTEFPAGNDVWRTIEKLNYILMTCHYPDLGKVSNWPKQISVAIRPIRSNSQLWAVTRHLYGISALVPQTSFRGKTSGSFAKCQLYSQANSLSVARLYCY